MNLDKIKIREKKTQKTKLITIRVTEHLSRWMTEKEYSPAAIFNEGVKDAGYKEDYKLKDPIDETIGHVGGKSLHSKALKLNL